MSRFTVDNRGGAASTGSFTLGATLGQPDAGSPASGKPSACAAGSGGTAGPPHAPAQVTGLRASNAAGPQHLTWDDVTHDTNGNLLTGGTYRVYRATEDPHFTCRAGE